MPELPEVETVVRDIRARIKGRIIKDCDICGYPPVLGNQTIVKVRKLIRGQKIVDVRRRGKHILIMLEQGLLDIHLRMTGQLTVAAREPQYTTFKIMMDKKNLFFSDTRKFGRVIFRQNLTELDRKLGVEPLSEKFSTEYLADILKKKTRMIKPFLLDQRWIAGIGNIYADEALFKAGIHPRQKTDRIPFSQVKLLCRSIKQILQKSIDYQGTTFINFAYGDSESGNFQNVLKVFDRGGLPCKRCKTIIKKVWVGQRGTHFCPACQKLRR